MKELQKSSLYWIVLISIGVVITFAVITSFWVRLAILSVLVLALILDTIRQIRTGKKSIIVSLKNAVAKFFDYVTSMG